ncbi:MAG: DUF5681 domain-containing protein [Candidatus Micrarchaeia archaeon]|jgi:hypothetical protein
MAFKKGQSGNPSGKPKGTLSKTTKAAMVLLDGEAEALTRKAINKAKKGDPVALKLCLERIIPLRRELPLSIKLPKVETVADIPKAMAAILSAVSRGRITPGEGQALSSMMELYRKGLELTELEARMAAIEEKLQCG